MKDKVIVITGGSKGLGKALAQMFVSKGNQVIICSRGKKEVELVAKEIGATAFVADVSKEGDVTALANFAVSTFGRIDIWINNAGVWAPKAVIEEADVVKWHAMFEINVFGTMYGAKAALNQMRKQGDGMLVNIISSSALTAKPTFSGYAASKWAVRGFNDSIREEYRDTPIKVVSVYPGGIQTNLFDGDDSVDISVYMSVDSVATKIVENLEQEQPVEDLIIRRSS